VLLGGVALLAVLVGLALAGVTRYTGVSAVLFRLQDTTAQIRIRGAVVLMLLFVVLAERLGLEVILGAFVAGGILRLVDRDMMERHPQTRPKLEALGYGFLIPVFFVSSGLRFDLGALCDASALARIPVFLAALLLARGLPALLYRRLLGGREVTAAALLQATSLPFIVAAAEIGVALGVLAESTAASMIAAGLLSVVAFPPVALSLLRRGQESTAAANPTSNRRHHTTAVE
jgi:Kef-type K+ transport system membrane component KefB